MKAFKRYLVATAIIPALLWVGCGAGSTQHTCESIDWKGSQCERLSEKIGNHATEREFKRELSK